MAKPTTFPAAPGLSTETQLYTQLLNNATGEANFRFTLAELLGFFTTNNVIIVQGIYDSDAAAATAGVAVGEYYETAPGHVEGIPPGLVRKRLI